MKRTYETNNDGMITHVMEETGNEYKRLNIYKWERDYNAYVIVTEIKKATLLQGLRRRKYILK